MYPGGHSVLDTPHSLQENTWPSLVGHRGSWQLEYGRFPSLPFNLVGLGWLDQHLDHSWGQLGSILVDQVAPQAMVGQP